MNPTREEFDALKREVAQMRLELDARKLQQLMMPLDNASLGVLNDAFYRYEFDRLKLVNLFFRTGNAQNPVEDGQMTYYDSGTVGFRTRIDGFNFQIDQTGV